MDDIIIIEMMLTLFGISYAGQWWVYRKVNSFSTAIKILCREHTRNHGGTEIEL